MIVTIKDNQEPEPVMRLSLSDRVGGVMVVGMDASGKTYDIAFFGRLGFRLMSQIKDRTGWPLDSDGHLLQEPS